MHKLQDAKLHIPIYSTYVHTDVHSGQAGRHDLWKFVISCQKLLADALSCKVQIVNKIGLRFQQNRLKVNTNIVLYQNLVKDTILQI